MKIKILSIFICMLLLASSTSLIVTADWSPGDGHKMHFPQLPDPSGWDVDATYVEGVFPQNCLSDDWMCSESGPITEIHFWGSWYNDILGHILAFNIAISSDIPADPPSIPYSRPGVTLWERTFYPDDWVVAGPWEGLQGWYDPGEGFYVSDNHELYYQYNIENIEDPFIQEDGTIYWLSISAIVHPDSPQPRWGWKSSDDHWNDDSVHGYWFELDWIELFEPPTFDTSLDLAFVINHEEPENNPPLTPSQLDGPSYGVIDEWIQYSTSTTDPDGDQVRYGIDHNSDGIVDYWSASYHNSGDTFSFNIKFSYPGTYYLRAKAKDVHGAESGWSTPKKVVISGPNDPPNTPNTPTGPSTGQIGNTYTFSTSTTDPDGDQVKLGWDWDGDGTIDEWSGLINSGSTDTRSHTWSSAGTYNIQVKAEDENGAQSDFSSYKTITISLNLPPNKPSITGPSSGRVGFSYTYTASTTDPNDDQVYYYFDWGDGQTTGWSGPYNSGQSASESHVWSNQGSYIVKVKSKDSNGVESIWSDPLSLNMPKNKYFEFLQELLNYFPRLERLINQFL